MFADEIKQYKTLELLKKLESMRDQSLEFHRKYVSNSSFIRSNKNFPKFRLAYLNRINEQFGEIFNNERILHILINVMQVSFLLFDGMNEIEIRKNFFDYFFLASMFLVIKLETPSLQKKLKTLACDLEMDLDIVFEIERLILNKMDWKINLSTPAEMKSLMLLLVNEKIEDDLENLMNNVINFSIFENEIYSKFDPFTITIASVFISFRHYGRDEHAEIAKVTKYLYDREIIETCIKEIFDLMNKNDLESESLLTETCENSSEFVVNDIHECSNSYDAELYSTASSLNNEIIVNSTDLNDDFKHLSVYSFYDLKKSESFIARKRLGKCLHVKKKNPKCSLDPNKRKTPKKVVKKTSNSELIPRL